MKDISVQENAARVAYIDKLYKLDGRHKKGHPNAGTFSGLHQQVLAYQKFCKDLRNYEKWKSRDYPEE